MIAARKLDGRRCGYRRPDRMCASAILGRVRRVLRHVRRQVQPPSRRADGRHPPIRGVGGSLDRGQEGRPTISLSNPHYDPDPQVALLPNPVPPGWAVLRATAYLTASNPDHNPPFSVAEWSGKCSSFPWFR